MATSTLSTLPLPRTPDPHEAPVLRWGVLGPGWIAHRFVDSLQANTGQQVVAVASRNQNRPTLPEADRDSRDSRDHRDSRDKKSSASATFSLSLTSLLFLLSLESLGSLAGPE